MMTTVACARRGERRGTAVPRTPCPVGPAGPPGPPRPHRGAAPATPEYFGSKNGQKAARKPTGTAP